MAILGMSGPPQRMQPGMSYTGGSANFNERTGMRNPIDGRSTQVMQAPPVVQTMMPQQGQIEPAFQQQQPQQQFGLAGAEQSLLAGQNAGISALAQTQRNALGSLGGNFNASAQQVDPMTGQPVFQQAAQGVGVFSPAGLQAQSLQAALSGAQGQQAFDEAFINDPGQAFLRQQGLDAVANQAAATGGLGGGEVLRELTRFGQGNAAQNIQQQIQNLGALSNQGLQAAAQQGQFLSQAGQQQGNLASTNAQLGTQANIASAGNRLNAAGQRAGIQSALGQQAANTFIGTGQDIGQARFQTGRDLASQIGQSTSALSGLANQQGSGLSDIIGAGGSNLANLLSGAGQFDAGQQMQLAQLLSNISSGQGSQLSNIALGQGNANAQAALAQGANQQQLIGNLAGSYGQYQGQQTPTQGN